MYNLVNLNYMKGRVFLLYVLTFSFLLFASLCFLNVSPLTLIKRMGNVQRNARDWLEHFLERQKEGRQNTLKQRIDLIQGRQRMNFWSKNFEQARKVLMTTNQQSKVKLLNSLCVVFFFAGAVIALLAQNILLLPVLSVGFTLIPMWYIKYNEYHYINRLSNELEVALSVVTTSYMRTENLLQSIEENLRYIESPVKEVFANFLNEVNFVNANVPSAIERMKHAFANSIYHEWCDTMLLCQDDRELKHSLQPIVDQFRDNKDLQQSMETILLQPTREYRNIVFIVLLTFPLLYFLNKDWFATLVGTFGGKALITALSVIIFIGMNKAINLSRPVD